MPVSLTGRTKKYLEGRGYVVDVCERWIPHATTTKDLFGFGDLVAFNSEKVFIVQATDFSHTSNRLTKILKSDDAKRWCMAPGRHIMLVAWDTRVKKGDVDIPMVKVIHSWTTEVEPTQKEAADGKAGQDTAGGASGTEMRETALGEEGPAQGGEGGV